MSSKYANLPDIDSSRDVYETADVDPSSIEAGHSDNDDYGLSNPAQPTGEELDGSRLPDQDEVGRFFKKAERRRSRRTIYTYPPSPGQSRSPSPGAASSTRGPPLRSRLRALQQELLSLEAEISDPSNPLLLSEVDGQVTDPGEMLKGLVEVRGKLGALSGGQPGSTQRTNLVEKAVKSAKIVQEKPSPSKHAERPTHTARSASIGDSKALLELDQRVAELEKLIGSTTTALDESSPLPPPLLPQINRLASQINLLTQPRHIDSISRRLKLLLTDLERHQAATKRSGASKDAKDAKEGPTAAPAIPADLMPVIQRLSPLLPTIPHLLQRLRTLSTLHTSASSFASTLSALEEEQARMRGSLQELKEAVDGVEGSIGENVGRVEGNLKGMEARLDDLMARLALLGSETAAPTAL